MALQLADVEKRLQSLIEINLTNYLPGPTYQDRIAQRLSETLQGAIRQAGGETQNLRDFALVIHPSTLDQWNKEPLLVDGLTRIFRLVIGELDLQCDASLSLVIMTDPLVEIDDLQIRILEEVNLAETQELKDGGDQIDEGSPTKPAFLIVGGTKVFAIESAVTNIGRRLDNHLVVDDPRVSRYHAQIRYARGRFIIFDLNSTGGTYVNGQRSSQSVLYPGDVISLAGLPIIFGQDNPPSSMPNGSTAPVTPVNSERTTAVLKDVPGKEKPKK